MEVVLITCDGSFVEFPFYRFEHNHWLGITAECAQTQCHKITFAIDVGTTKVGTIVGRRSGSKFRAVR